MKRKPHTIVEEKQMVTITRKVLWTSPDGTYVVVEGPFPYRFQRCMTGDSVWRAAQRDPADPDEGIQARGETTQKGKFAKTLRELVLDPENEWGEVAP